ncbi:MAG: glycosyltransferase family 2 protein [Nitrospira sp.]
MSRFLDRPFVSIVCATYNRAHVLPRAVQSVLAQSFSNWELLVVDDGSTDHTPSVMTHCRNDPRIQYFRLETNCGVGVARNRGIQQAHAPWITVLDSDNALSPDALKGMVAATEERPQIEFHQFCVQSFTGKMMGRVPGAATVISGRDYICNRFPGEYVCLVKTALLRSTPFIEEFNGGEGIVWSRIALTCKAIAYYPMIAVLYDTEGADRLSVRTKNYHRLERVFRTDISSLWRVYLWNCPMQLAVRMIKWVVYATLARCEAVQ